MPCTSSVFSHEQYRTGEVLAAGLLANQLQLTLEVLSCSSLLCTALHLIERITSGQANMYPGSMQLHFAFCLFMLSGALCMNTFVGDGWGEHPNWCLSKYHSLCTVQAALVNYFALAVMFWWLAVCVHLYLAVVVYHERHQPQPQEETSPNLLPTPSGEAGADTVESRIQRDTSQWQTHFKVLSYSIPGVITLLLLFCGELGAGGTAQLFCWIKDDNQQWWQFAFFYIELGLVFSVGAILFLRYSCYGCSECI